MASDIQHCIRTLRLKVKCEGYAWLNAAAIEVNQVWNYANATSYKADFNDITTGFCSFYDANLAVLKWDVCTGVGSPKTYVGK